MLKLVIGLIDFFLQVTNFSAQRTLKRRDFGIQVVQGTLGPFFQSVELDTMFKLKDYIEQKEQCYDIEYELAFHKYGR